MIEEDTRAGKHLVALTEIHCDPVPIELGYPIGAPGIEWRLLILWHRLHFAKHLRGAGLIEADWPICQPYSLKHTGNAKACVFACSNCLLE